MQPAPSLGALSSSGFSQSTAEISHTMQSGKKRLDRTTIDRLQEAMKGTMAAKEKDLLVLVGNLDVGNGAVLRNLLGTTPTLPESLYPQVYPQGSANLTVVNVCHMLDKQPTENTIVIANSLRVTLEQARSVQLALCFSFSQLDKTKAAQLPHALRHILDRLILGNENRGSIVLMITDEPSTSHSLEEVIAKITEIRDSLSDGPALKAWYDFILREEGKYICVCPTSSPLLARLQAINKKIQKPKEAFKTTFLLSACTPLRREIKAIAKQGCQFFEDCRDKVAAAQKYRSKIATIQAQERQLNERMNLAHQAITASSSNNKGAETIIREQTAILQEQKASSDSLQLQQRTLEAEITTLQREIEKFNQTAEEIVAYPYTCPPPTITESEGEIQRAIFGYQRCLQYGGPAYESIEKTPSDPKWWINETKNEAKTSYAITFRAEKNTYNGVAPSLKIFVKKRNLLTFAEQKLTTLEQIRQKTEALQQLTIKKATAIAAMHEAQKLISSAEHVKTVTSMLEPIQKTRVKTTEKLTAIDAAITALKRQINENREDFAFVEECNKLDTTHLESHPSLQSTVTRLLTLRREYSPT